MVTQIYAYWTLHVGSKRTRQCNMYNILKNQQNILKRIPTFTP